MSFANSKPYHIAKAFAISKSNNEKTCKQLTATTTLSLSLTVTPIFHLPLSIRPTASLYRWWKRQNQDVQL